MANGSVQYYGNLIKIPKNILAICCGGFNSSERIHSTDDVPILMTAVD
jgi:hypothetical protein